MVQPRLCSDFNQMYQGSATVFPGVLCLGFFFWREVSVGFLSISFPFCPFFTNDLELWLKVLEWTHRLAMILSDLLKKRFLKVWRFLIFFPFSLCYLLNPVNICLKLPLTSTQSASCCVLCIFLQVKNSGHCAGVTAIQICHMSADSACQNDFKLYFN